MITDEWTKTANFVKEVYGAYVDWENEYFICPECEEPIYKCDWDDFSICPVCGFDLH